MSRIRYINIAFLFFFLMTACGPSRDTGRRWKDDAELAKIYPDVIVREDRMIIQGVIRARDKEFVILERAGDLILVESDQIENSWRYAKEIDWDTIDSVAVSRNCLKGDCFNGNGLLYYHLFDRHEAYLIRTEFERTVPTGEGSIRVFDARNGNLRWNYTGGILKGKREGNGEWTRFNGDGQIIAQARGQWSDGIPDGFQEQKVFYDDGTLKYRVSGVWTSGKMMGEGESQEYNPRGVLTLYYKGEFQKGMHHGFGIEKAYFPNGKIKHFYEGNWKNHNREGTGKFIRYGESGEMIFRYDGEWKRDMRNGKGITIVYREGVKIREVEARYKDDHMLEYLSGDSSASGSGYEEDMGTGRE